MQVPINRLSPRSLSIGSSESHFAKLFQMSEADGKPCDRSFYTLYARLNKNRSQQSAAITFLKTIRSEERATLPFFSGACEDYTQEILGAILDLAAEFDFLENKGHFFRLLIATSENEDIPIELKSNLFLEIKRLNTCGSFREINLEGVNLAGFDLSGFDLQGANLCKANLKLTTLSHANLSNAFLAEANLELAELFRANLTNACLIKANLSGANLIDTCLFYANFFQANLTEAHLNHAFLEHAVLTEACLTDASLVGAKMKDALL